MALFPLGLFLLPGERASLHIFEQRYRELLSDCEKLGITFGIPYQKDTATSNIGSVVRVVEITKRYQSGEADIIVECIGFIRIAEMYATLQGKSYPGGRVQLVELDLDRKPAAATLELFDELLTLLSNGQKRPEDAMPTIAAILNVVSPEPRLKVQIANQRNPEQQEELLRRAIRYSILLCRQENATESGVYLS